MIPEKALNAVSQRGAEPQRKTNLEYETWNLEFQPKVGVIARSIELGENDVAIPGSLHHAPGVIRDDNLALFLDVGCWMLDLGSISFEI